MAGFGAGLKGNSSRYRFDRRVELRALIRWADLELMVC
jgi:hypothetical protein